MKFRYFLIVTIFLTIAKCTESTVWTLIHDLVQDNVAGTPVIHEHTEWDFHPDDGKARRVQFEALNGPRAQDLIDRIGNGAGFKGPWGVKVQRVKPDVVHTKQPNAT